MKKIQNNIAYLLILSLFFSLACEQEIQDEIMIHQSYNFLLGSYTNNESEGIGMLAFDPENNILEAKVISQGIANPSFVVANKSEKLVFAVEETGGEKGGNVKSFKFKREDNSMELIDSQNTFGDSPCYIALDGKEEFLVVGNYSSGNFSVYRIKEGKLNHVQTIQHEGQSIIKNRQSSAHVHSAAFHPDGKHLLVADLGTDKIHIYQFNPDYAVPFQPAPIPYYEVEAGAGPRHLLVHPSGSPVYLVHELTAEVGVYGFESGKMNRIQSLPLTSSDFAGNVGAAEIRISPDSRFIYVSNRGDANEISVFEIEKDGKLQFIERINSGGEMPRNFIITNDGKYLLVAHQQSGNITVFERNQKTGKLLQLDLETQFQKPVYFFGLN